jgi:hypothetical protein
MWYPVPPRLCGPRTSAAKAGQISCQAGTAEAVPFPHTEER